MNASAPRTLTIVDDDPIVRRALALMMGRSPHLKVVQVLADGVTAVRQARVAPTDTYLIDVAMPDMDGPSTAYAIRKVAPRSRIVLLTSLNRSGGKLLAESVGASALILKTTQPCEIAAALLGEEYRTTPEVDMAGEPDLSGREMDVLQLLCRAYSNADIAAELAISESTVKSHVSAIMHKLGASSRLQVVTTALQQGICSY